MEILNGPCPTAATDRNMRIYDQGTRRKMTKAVKVLPLLFVLVLSVASAGLAADGNVPGDGVFKFKDIVLKFIPPPGWQVDRWILGSLHFRPLEEANSKTDLRIFMLDENGSMDKLEGEDFLEGMAAAAKKTKNVKVKKEKIISFLGAKALDLEMISTFEAPPQLACKSITFMSGGRKFQIEFSAEARAFETLLPEVKESFKTFEIISPEPDPSWLVSKNTFLTATSKLRDKFRVILVKLCLEMLTAAQKDGEVQSSDESVSAAMQEKSQSAAFAILSQYKAAVEVPEAEAEKILNGEIDDEKNAQSIWECAGKFQQSGVSFPGFLEVLGEKFRHHALSSLEVELTARILETQVRQMETSSKQA